MENKKIKLSYFANSRETVYSEINEIIDITNKKMSVLEKKCSNNYKGKITMGHIIDHPLITLTFKRNIAPPYMFNKEYYKNRPYNIKMKYVNFADSRELANNLFGTFQLANDINRELRKYEIDS